MSDRMRRDRGMAPQPTLGLAPHELPATPGLEPPVPDRAYEAFDSLADDLPPAAASATGQPPPSAATPVPQPRPLETPRTSPATAPLRTETPPTASRERRGLPMPRAGGRGVEARLARLHLRGGLLSLARAELEQMAGVGTLDRDALADLAETRWRSGDLEGAAEAAEAHLAAGGDEPMAHVIAAEKAEREGRMVDARRHAGIVQRQVGPGLDRLFAGEARSTAWPMAVSDWMDSAACTPGRWGLLVGGAEVSTPDAGTWAPVPLPEASPALGPASRAGLGQAQAPGGGASPTTEQQQAAGRVAARELAGAEAELARCEIAPAVDRLGLLLRLDPTLAASILPLADRAVLAAGEHHASLASLQLLRGDALRALGRDVEAAEAFGGSMRALSARAISEGTTT